jgi:hypothetical protein
VQSQAGYERLEAYGFGVDYPLDCLIEFNPKSTRKGGDVALKSPHGYKLFLSWGDLEKVKKLSGTEGHADYSLNRMKASREARIEEVHKESMVVNGHRASFRDVRLDLVKRGIFFNTTKSPTQVRSLHVHCDVSSRYFVIYSPVSPAKAEEQSEVVLRMIKTFACHSTDGERTGVQRKG